MPRQKTGRPLGRRPVYQDESERPVTISLRIPRDLEAQMKRYASLHRQSVTELLLDGLKWRIGDGEYYSNTETSAELLRETDHTAVLAEIRTALARQETQLHALAQALEQRPAVSPPNAYYSNTAKAPVGQHSTPEPVREGDGGQPPQEMSGEKSNTVLQGNGHAAARAPSAQQPARPDKAALVVRLHEMRARGMSLKAMADQLQAEGLPTLSGKGQWQKGTVDKLLHSQLGAIE
jgi:hypothetical protein